MSFGFSIGDLVLCSQITYRLFTAATTGRKNAPRDLQELEGVLFGLNCSLTQVQRASVIIFSRNFNTLDDAADVAPDVAPDVAQQLGFMIRSCLQTLEHLERATDKYRATVTTPSLLHGKPRANFLNSQQLTSQVKLQWRRIMWDLRGESLTQYRRKLESHLNVVNLLLNVLIWSATDRIEQNGMRQGKRIEELLHRTSYFNNVSNAHPKYIVLNSLSGHSRGSSPSVTSAFESVLSRPRPRRDQNPAGVYPMGSQRVLADLFNGIRA
ncbi:hypothetical protein PENCOP_c005G05966 [Penicillium coprophilum]|uniref:Fungal N-terminal domain-containing protein n=1 Tax=Penicillium coprophilum TaxID=36646 RepID=A0A1V6USQ8_9EURO|nr:hypothetical protein PENCOP_c005G05966 [Penicillium coprophilum]